MTSPVEAATPDLPAKHIADGVSLGESRLWPAAALLVYLALNIALRVWLPGDSPVRVPWLLPAVEGTLLVLLLAPTRAAWRDTLAGSVGCR